MAPGIGSRNVDDGVGRRAYADLRPTNQQLEVQKVLRDEVRKHQSALAAIVGKELKALNELMRGRGVPNIVIRAPGSSQ
jgi:hypothetical protein